MPAACLPVQTHRCGCACSMANDAEHALMLPHRRFGLRPSSIQLSYWRREDAATTRPLVAAVPAAQR
jgi:hypothetical protein